MSKPERFELKDKLRALNIEIPVDLTTSELAQLLNSPATQSPSPKHPVRGQTRRGRTPKTPSV